MIWESAPWKDGLLKDAEILERWARKASRPNRQGMIFEKKIFLAAYSIRKLIESEKICTTLQRKSLRVESFGRTNSYLTPRNWDNIDTHYEIENPMSQKLTVNALINQIIHSHIFLLNSDESGVITGFFVSSSQQNNVLRRVELSRFLALMREIGSDHPTHSTQWLEGGVWKHEQSCPNHPSPKIN